MSVQPASRASETWSSRSHSTSRANARSEASDVLDRPCDAAGRRDVVVLDERRVAEAHTVIDPAAASHRVLLELPKTRQRLPRVAHATARSFDRTNPGAGRGRDPREVRHEIEHGPLGDQQRAQRPSTPQAPCRPGATVSPSRRFTATSASGKPTASSTTSATSTPHTTPVLARDDVAQWPVGRREWSLRWSRRGRNEGPRPARRSTRRATSCASRPAPQTDASSSRFTRPPSLPRSSRSLRQRCAG